MALDAANNTGNGATTGGGGQSINNINKVIHLFASRADGHGLKPVETSSAVSTNSCCLLCAGGGIVRTFYLCNLGICWAERGLDFSLVDLETRAPTSAYLFGSDADVLTSSDTIHPAKHPYDILYKSFIEHFVPIRGKTALKILLPNMKREGFSLQSTTDEETVNALKTYLCENSATYINLPEAFLETGLLSSFGVEKFLLITKPDLKSIIQTYDLIKKIYSKVQNASLAVLIHRSSDINMVHAIYMSLARTVKIELGKELKLIGNFPDDQAIAGSILERQPLAVNPEFRNHFETIAGSLSDWVEENKAQNEVKETIQTAVPIVKNMGMGI